jgi:hypothetical protein
VCICAGRCLVQVPSVHLPRYTHTHTHTHYLMVYFLCVHLCRNRPCSSTQCPLTQIHIHTHTHYLMVHFLCVHLCRKRPCSSTQCPLTQIHTHTLSNGLFSFCAFVQEEALFKYPVSIYPDTHTHTHLRNKIIHFHCVHLCRKRPCSSTQCPFTQMWTTSQVSSTPSYVSSMLCLSGSEPRKSRSYLTFSQ